MCLKGFELAVSRSLRENPDPHYLNLSGKCNASGSPGFSMLFEKGPLSGVSIAFVDNLADAYVLDHEKKHKDDLFLPYRLGPDKALDEVLTHLSGFPMESTNQVSWRRLGQIISRHPLVKHHIGRLPTVEREKQSGILGDVLTNCYHLYAHMRGAEGMNPQISQGRVLNLLESSVEMEQFNRASQRILAGEDSRQTVAENLRISRQKIRARTS